MADRSDPERPERLFRAAIWSFSAIPRPSRSDLVLLDDLGIPLYPYVGPSERRDAALTLSRCEAAPPGLLRLLADEPLDIAEPVLVSARGLTDVDLVDIVGRHGLGHARAILRRPYLNPAIAELIAALETNEAIPGPDARARDVRQRLRSMMRPSLQDDRRSADATTPSIPNASSSDYFRLRAAALSGRADEVRRALSVVFALEPSAVDRLLPARDHTPIMAALRALDLEPERAFFLVAALYPSAFSEASDLRLFLRRYRLIALDDARALIRALHVAPPPGGGETIVADAERRVLRAS